jgi:predicted HNH restriction endonuclease
MTDYLQYWKYAYNEEQIEEGVRIVLTAGEQLGGIQRGDTVWIVTTISRRLHLLGRVVASKVVGKRAARKHFKTSNVWDARYHVIAKRGTVAPLRLIDIASSARLLRFNGDINRLPKDFSGRSFQSLRTLTAESAALLQDLWAGERVPSRSTSDDSVSAAIEGARVEAVRYVRGRSGRLRLEALNRARGRCEACCRDFSRVLNGLGSRVLQVHHRKQLAETEAPRLTKLDDLAVLCANCHSLVHADPRLAMRVDDLHRLLKAQGARKRR